MRSVRFITMLCLASALPAVAATSAIAQSYPDKPVRIVVPLPAGSPGDTFARAFQAKLQEALGQPFVIDNRPGANTNIGAEAVAKSAPDGYTFLLTASPHTINPSLYPSLPYDPIKDFTGVTLVAVTPLVLVVNPSLPVTSVAQLIAYLKARPGQVNYGSAGNGSTLQLAGEMFNLQANVKMVHVPYKGVTQAMTDLLGGQISLMFPGGPIALPQVKAGKLRALATTGAKRTSAAMDLPTVAEAGLPGFEIAAWYGLLAPAGTPASAVSRVNGVIVKALQTPEYADQWTKLGADVIFNTPAQFNAFLRSDLDKWAKVVKAANIKAD